MKNKILTILGCLLTIAFTGCVRLPSVSQFPSTPLTPAHTGSANPVSLPAGVLPGETAAPASATKPAKAPSPTRTAIQHAVNWLTVICILGALAAVAFGAFLIYGGQILAGAKCVSGGVLLMIASIWFAYHWLLVCSLALIGGGVYLAIMYWSQIAPVLKKLEEDISPAIASVESKIVPAATATTAAAPAIPAPAPASAPVQVGVQRNP